MRKFLVLCVVFILTLISPIYAFADDPEESNSSVDRLATEEELQELDTAISETSHNLALLMASGDSVKATDYEQATYNLLSSVFGSSTSSWASIVATRLGYLSTINTSANGLVVKLTQFYNSINPDYDTTGISMYDIGHGILTALTSIDPNDGDLTIIETLVYITSALDDLHTDLTAILNSTYSIDSKLVNINTAIVQFKSDLISAISSLKTDMNTGFTNVNANMQLIINRLISMQNDFNNVVWNDYDNSYLGFTHSISDISYTTGSFTQIDYPTGYFIFKNPALNGNYIFKFVVPVRCSLSNRINDFVSNIQMVNSSGNVLPGKYFISYDIQRQYLNIYVYDFVPFYASSSNIIIQVYFSRNYIISNTGYFSYLRDDTIDYYIAYQYLTNKNQNNVLFKFESLYASDDLIAAKEDQQDYEDQAIQDFTGSGSAAASNQDLGDMKSISGAIKSGLQTGGSVNNALAPFNTNSGFWGWFSQSNYDNINNIPSSGTRSGNSSQPDIIDFYTNNQYTLQGLLSGGGN